MTTDLHVSWEQYNALVEQLAAQVWESGWQFDAIVCLARGGLRVGDVLSRLFERPLGVLFTSAYREDSGTRQGELRVGEHISSAQPLPSGRWLLVDDLVDSGGTLEQVLPILRERNPQVREIRTAVLWTKGSASMRPDYCVERLADDPWIHQPFECYDRMRPAELQATLGTASGVHETIGR